MSDQADSKYRAGGAHALLGLLSIAPAAFVAATGQMPALLEERATVVTGLTLIATASAAVYAGSWRSVKPEGQKADDQKVAMTESDAMRFPVMGSAVLLSLFAAIKVLPRHVINQLMGLYFVFLGTLAITVTALPFLEPLAPASLRAPTIRAQAVARRIPGAGTVLRWLEIEEESMSPCELAAGLASLALCAVYHVGRHWVLNNAIGLCLSIQAIEMLSLGSVQVGLILLSGLFVYDVFWVFFTPVMVTVATSFEAPIKLLFLRGVADGTPKFSMLGLGDIVIPGVYVAMMLRLDHSRKFESNYFAATFASYVLGLAATLVVMNVFNHAQPALLYLVPAVLGATLLVAVKRGELGYIWAWRDEAAEAEGNKKKE